MCENCLGGVADLCKTNSLPLLGLRDTQPARNLHLTSDLLCPVCNVKVRRHLSISINVAMGGGAGSLFNLAFIFRAP